MVLINHGAIGPKRNRLFPSGFRFLTGSHQSNEESNNDAIFFIQAGQ